MNDFRWAIQQEKVLFLDGATGTMLQQAGMPVGVSPERFCQENPKILQNIHEAYIKAGADIITCCTFGANPYKLSKDIDIFAFNRQMVEIARAATEVSDRPIYVAGNLGPSGQFVKPLGPIEPKDLIQGYVEQIKGLVAGGVDLLLIETQFDLAEARACVIAAREVTDLPLIVSMTFEGGSCLTGSSPEIFVATMANLGVDVVGTNCSLGPVQMEPVVKQMLAIAPMPLMAEPNAGLPVLEGDKTVFPLNPDEFAAKTAPFAQLGCRILGGCCGTTPLHISKLKAAVENLVLTKLNVVDNLGVCLTTRTNLVRLAPNAPLVLIGERINPTGKKRLTQEFQSNILTYALELADEQIAHGARVLDCNVGAPLVDETHLLPELVALLTSRLQVPLALDSSNAKAIINALPYCPGSPLVNSISGEVGRLDELGPICKQYGAPFILLPLQGKELPETTSARLGILENLLAAIERLGIPKRLIVVDLLALTVSSTPDGAKVCLETLAFCRKMGLATTLGLSNISFGLPARELLNATFLSMAAGGGLTSCIANPKASRIREALAAIDVLNNCDAQAKNFIADYGSWSSKGESLVAPKKTETLAKTLYDAVLQGDKENVLKFVAQELEGGQEPYALVQDILIPAITEVGAKYEKKEYFLPQLIRAAETMQKAFAELKPRLAAKQSETELPVIVMATVEGDIHDIGKNIVSLLLGNHGFQVIDLGKDVPATKIVACAIEHKAKIIGLSALMTTTMVKMEETIKLVKKQHLPMKVMIGGAAVTQSFADKIGADAYCVDAVMAVRTAKEILTF
ncbi:MAG: homocysteine S-methyltransferase family protein [Desulfovibrionaceae bacterium]|nr:homocysteine S-methyltransferase family protein [Desulfovibrionaceae bacterium]